MLPFPTRLPLARAAVVLSVICAAANAAYAGEPIEKIAQLALGWRGEIIAEVDQSYNGWDVEIGDANSVRPVYTFA